MLDIGCGIGRIERALAPLVGTITAIDISPGMIDEARRRCRDLANVHFHQCNGRDLAAFDDRSFDLILAIRLVPCTCSPPIRRSRHDTYVTAPGYCGRVGPS